MNLLILLPMGLSRLTSWVYVQGEGHARDELRVTQLSRGPEPASWAFQVLTLAIIRVQSPGSHSRQPCQILPLPLVSPLFCLTKSQNAGLYPQELAHLKHWQVI